MDINVRNVDEILRKLEEVYPDEIEGEEVAKKFGKPLERLGAILKYMEEKNLIQIRGILGNPYKRVKLTAYGIDAIHRIQKAERKLELWDL